MSIKDTWKKLFKSGWKNGLKNAFKIFIFDMDDLKINTTFSMKNSVQWVSDGTKLVPTPNYTEGFDLLNKYGLDGLPMDKFGNLDTQALSKKVLGDSLPNGSSFDISDFSGVRGNKYTMNPRNGTTNFSQANQKLMESSGEKIKILEEKLGFKLTWHEESNLKTLTLLPFELHNSYAHTGGIGIYEFMFPRTSNIIKK